MRDDMGRVVVTRLGRMRLVADPSAPALEAVAGLHIVRGMDQLRRRGHVSCLPPAEWVIRAVILLYPDLAEYLHREGGTDVRGASGAYAACRRAKPSAPMVVASRWRAASALGKR